MKVLITGGTGYVGSHTTAAVCRDGHEVRLLVRDPTRVDQALRPLNVDVGAIDIVVGDVTDPAAVVRALDGMESVIHLASVFSMDSRQARRMRNINVPGTRTVFDQARLVGADPIVYGSSYAALLPTLDPLSTDTPPGRTGRTVPTYFRAQAEAERIARQRQADGDPLVIVNLMTTLGPHDPHMGDQLTRVRNATLGRLKLMPVGGFCVNDVRDVAALFAATLVSGLGPRRFIPPGRYVSTREYLSVLGAVTGRRLRSLFPPAKAVLPVCWCVDLVQHFVPWHIPAEYTAAYMCYCDTRLDESVPAAPLGIVGRPFEETVRDSVQWLYQQGHITARQAGLATSSIANGAPSPGSATSPRTPVRREPIRA